MKLPEKFVERINNQLGKEADIFLSSLDQNAPVSIRINRPKHPGMEGDNIGWCDSGFYLDERPSFTLDPLFHAGTYYVQEPSSMFIEQVFKQLIPVDEPVVVLDLCAAPGGKSTHIASLLNEKSLLVTNEVINSRAKILSENIIKWGTGNVVVTNNDPKDFSCCRNLFDVILIDAPCSGEGLFRKDKNAVTEWSPENAHLCSMRQRRILNDILPGLKPGGLLIYSTCTFNPEENEQNVEWLCREYELACLPLQLNPLWGIEEKKSADSISYHFYPHKAKGEGLFLSVLKRKDEGEEFEINSSKEKIFSLLQKELPFVQEWIKPTEEKKLFVKNNTIYLLPSRHIDLIESFHKNLRVTCQGVEVGSIKNLEVLPSHPLAMYTHLNKNNFDCIEVSKEEALRYLRRDEIFPPSEKKGWKLITYHQIPLGWIKHLGNRINNYYPLEWRIRKAIS